jgi:hypothetical protein
VTLAGMADPVGIRIVANTEGYRVNGAGGGALEYWIWTKEGYVGGFARN